MVERELIPRSRPQSLHVTMACAGLICQMHKTNKAAFYTWFTLKDAEVRGQFRAGDETCPGEYEGLLGVEASFLSAPYIVWFSRQVLYIALAVLELAL